MARKAPPAQEAFALSRPFDSLLLKSLNKYQDQFMPFINELAKKMVPLCILQPEHFPPGEVVPLELVFEFDYRKTGFRKQFTLVEANLLSYADLLESMRSRGADAETRAIPENFKTQAVEHYAGRPLPVLFAFWM